MFTEKRSLLRLNFLYLGSSFSPLQVPDEDML